MKPKKNHKPSPLKDNFLSPPSALWPLLPYLEGFQRIWEPAAGYGTLTYGLAVRGFKVVETDINTGVDFFDVSLEDKNGWEFPPEAQVSNPPFSVKQKWLEHAATFKMPFAYLLPSEIISTGWIHELQKQIQLEFLILNKRVNFKTPLKRWKDSSPQFPVMWVCHNILPEPLIFANVYNPPKQYFTDLEYQFGIPTYRSLVKEPKSMDDLVVDFDPKLDQQRAA